VLNFPQLSLLGLAAVVATLAIFVWRARPENPINRWFAVYAVSMAGWIVGIAGLHGESHLDLWGRFAFANASLMPAAFLAFTRVYPTTSAWPPPLILRINLGLGSLIAALSLTTPLLVYDVTMTVDGLGRKTGALYPVFAVYFLTGWGAALALFISKFRKASGMARAQLQYLSAGLILPVAGAIVTNLIVPLLTGRSTYSWLGPYFGLFLVGIVGHAIIRHRLMDIRPVLTRGASYIVTLMLLSGAGITLGRLTVSDWNTLAFSLRAEPLMVVLTILVILTTPAQRVLSWLIDPYLYRGRMDYSSALRDATHRLSRLMQPKDLASELQQLLSTAFVPELFVMTAQSPSDGSVETFPPESRDIAEVLTSSSVANLLSAQPHPSVLTINPSRATGIAGRAHEALRAAGVEIVLCLGRRGQSLGTVLIGQRRSGDAYFANDLSFLESLAELASISLENSLLYRERIQVLEYSDRLLESLDSAVVAIDVAGRITSFNPAARHLLGVEDTAPNSSLIKLPPEISWALTFAVTRSWLPRDVEISIDHPTRGVLPVVLSTAVLRDERNAVTGALVVVTDLSTVKALEKNQRRIEHLATMARFYAGIAHEIRNPLAAISNLVSMLPDRFNDAEYRDTASRLLPLEIARIVRLSDRLRLMAPSEDGKLVPVSLGNLLSDIVAIHSPAAAEANTHVDLHCAEDLPRILGDPSQLVQLFVNLLKNALEAMPNGGTVTIQAGRRRSLSGDERVIVRVADEGIGIGPEVRAKIFQPFFTTKVSGTGLGLSICREIADFHRATLDLVNKMPGYGTVAEIQFPALAADNAESERVLTSAASTGLE
jgi:two-component system nitrogen regulation sensor histidine kinase GlnL